MYTSIEIVYGVAFNHRHANTIRSWPENDPRHQGCYPLEDLETYGFVRLPGLDSSGNPIGFVGIKLDSRAVIPGDPIPYDRLNIKPTEDQKSEAQKLWDNLDTELKAVGTKLQVYMIPYES